MRRTRLKTAIRGRRARGFTLIEVLIGMFILGVAVLGLAQMFLLSIRNNSRGGEISRSTFLAQQQINYLRTLTAAELNTFPSTVRGEQSDEAIDLNNDGAPDYRRITILAAAGRAYTVKVLVFPPTKLATARDTLVANPNGHLVRALMNTFISR